MRITLTKRLNQKLLLILFIPTLVLGTFLLTGFLMAVTGSALSAIIVVLVVLITVAPWFELASDDVNNF